MPRDSYTHYPRTILWLVPGGPARQRSGAADSEEIEPFYLSKWPITNEQFEAYDPAHERSPLSPGDRHSAISISFAEAQGYCEWYAEVSRKPMRLPTEAEWEHACRGETLSRFFWGDDPAEGAEYLWDADNSKGVLGEADKKRANGFGLYGMLGGVWEWAVSRDWQPALRGGSFLISRSEISCSLRKVVTEGPAGQDVGFRVAKSLRR